LIALSYSRISDYRQCPGKFKLKYLDKAPNFQIKDEDKSPALVRGGNIHKSLENYVISKLNGTEYNVTMPEVMGTTPLIDKIMDNYNVMPEKQIAIDENFKEVSWFAKNAYFRVILDLIGFGNDLFLGDYKTGKLTDYIGTDDKLGQLHMSALVGLSLWEEYESCTSVYIYVDHKIPVPIKVVRDDIKQMKEALIREHYEINSDIVFACKKNQYCKWCPATKSQCSFAVK